MKNRIIMIFVLFGWNIAFGQNVAMEEAALKAYQFHNSPRNIAYSSVPLNALEVMPFVENNDTLLYFVKSDFFTVIVPGVKCLPPILCCIKYTSNNLEDYFLTPGANYFLFRYLEFARHAINENNREILPEWENVGLSSEERLRSVYIPPLLTSKWGQSISNIGGEQVAYNYYVEESCTDCSSGISPLGCAAVAMGQVMYYYKYPVLQLEKTAAEQIDWCNMYDSLNTDRPNYEKERNAVAHLLRNCGLACDMSYCYNDKCQSFAWPRDVRKALVEVFSYSSDAILLKRIKYNDYEWDSILKAQLMAKHPVIYASVKHDTSSSIFNGYGAHFFVCDGYDEANDLFHFNFGFRGTCDDWYNIDNLIAGGSDYNWFERAIINIYPLEGAGLCDYPLALSNYYHFYYNIYGNSTPAAYSNIPVASVLYSAPESSSVPTSWRTIPAGATAEYVAHKEIVLLPGFTAEYGSDFTARIEPCAACGERMMQVAVVGDSTAEADIDTSGLEQRLYRSGDKVFAVRPSDITLFPNPAEHTITVQTPDEVKAIQMFDLSGRPVYRWYIASRTEESLTIDIADIPSGAYILQLTTANGQTHAGRFVKN